MGMGSVYLTVLDCANPHCLEVGRELFRGYIAGVWDVLV